MSKVPVVTAIIVTYFPDYKFVGNLQMARDQCDFVVVVDNTPKDYGFWNTRLAQSVIISNDEPINQLTDEYKIFIFKNKANLGLSVSYNKAVNVSRNLGTDYVVFLDQDSELTGNAVVELLRQYLRLSKLFNVGGIGCTNIDVGMKNDNRRKSSNFSIRFHNYYEDEDVVEVLVKENSGFMIRMDKLLELGDFDESFFLDGVDYELCMRMRTHGLNLFRAKKSVIWQSAGKVLPIRFLGKEIRITTRNPDRTYFIFREYIRLLLTYWNRSFLFMTKMLLDLGLLSIKIIVIYGDKKLHFANALKGLRDGLLKGKVRLQVNP